MTDFNDTECFKTQNYKYCSGTDAKEIIIEAVAVLRSSCDIKRKYAATLVLKALVREQFLKYLLSQSKELYPFSRSDSRVVKWTKEVLSRNKCEKCGASDKLEAHHIIKWADYPQGRIDINNGQCLCHRCHTDAHIGDQSYYMMKAKE